MSDPEHIPLDGSKSPAESETVQQASPELWNSLTSRWNAILGLEAQIETLRLGLEGQRGELEGMTKQTLVVEERMNALQNDVAQWNKAKSRVHYALPRVREFVHRANLAACAPERKRLDEVAKHHLEARVPFAGMEKTLAEMEHLMKDRQALLTQGNTVSQECRLIAGEIRNTLAALRRNAASNVRRKRAAK